MTRFVTALEAAKGKAHLADNLEQAWEILRHRLESIQARRVVVSDQAPLKEVDLPAIFPEIEVSIARGDFKTVQKLCLAADVGLTNAQAGLAQTGSVVIHAGAGLSRQVSLLPDVHFVLLPAALLVPDLITWESVRPSQMPSQVLIISGPSKTADIEQTLVVGAHGPKRFEVILYGQR
ncbi:MAG: lactate utilization protein [Chloroflexota bacterium]